MMIGAAALLALIPASAMAQYSSRYDGWNGGGHPSIGYGGQGRVFMPNRGYNSHGYSGYRRDRYDGHRSYGWNQGYERHNRPRRHNRGFFGF